MNIQSYFSKHVKGKWINMYDIAGLPMNEDGSIGPTLIVKILEVHTGFVEYIDATGFVGVKSLDALSSFSFCSASRVQAYEEELKNAQVEEQSALYVNKQLMQLDEEITKKKKEKIPAQEPLV